MANEKIKYSNGCSPQELESTGVRWFQDSDVGTKLSGSANVSMGSGSLAFVSPVSITGNQTALTSKDFVFIKCISGDDVKVSFDNGSNFLVRLSAGESFASELDSSVATVIIGTDGTSEIEYLSGT
tara:strand:+ start:643 stop:1020 length:378 start_codon:yes stop_codon:yes gene_type:complete